MVVQQHAVSEHLVLAQIQPQEPFTFNHPEKWMKCSRHYWVVSGLEKEGKEAQINTWETRRRKPWGHLFCLTTRKQSSTTLSMTGSRLTWYLQKNVIYKRAKFSSCKQEEEETVDSFITALYALAEHCRYESLQEEMIRDKVIVRIPNKQLSERLQLDPNLTLEKAIMQACQAEAAKLRTAVGAQRQNYQARDHHELCQEGQEQARSQVVQQEQTGCRSQEASKHHGMLQLRQVPRT